ncbi:8-oxo-dGTP diphosphatase [Rhodanobacter sp. K2T2]|uniref:Nudix family hydrolase n=1 Tax=Rhodanobacter sp. K2T2 TaxID=2723085 RepID=UPI0015C9D1E3|nr:Nudix family hydrolase [Rhodanobacter sp. K2T2]NYE28096.1 8-oxo-dGTP diphosphatase [Rhodanobacter sp. K2T2]
MHVMAGLMIDGEGRVLLAERPQGKHLAGFWEFPGGKLEAGELPLEALARELREELGIELQSAQPLIRVPWTYDDRRLVLDAWRVDAWLGAPQSLEGQALQWCYPAAIDPESMTPADRPILQALRLPATYAVSPADVAFDQRDVWLKRIREVFSRGVRLLLLRLPLWPVESVRELARDLLPAAQAHDVQLVLDGDIEGARMLGVGVQLSSEQGALLSERPLPWRQLVGVSCHAASQLAKATQIQADFATWSMGTESVAESLDASGAWTNFQSLAEEASLPVYADGDTVAMSMDRAKSSGAQGIVTTEAW